MTKDVSNSPDHYTGDLYNVLKTLRERDMWKFDDPEAQKNNMEYDLRTTDWILEKVRSNDTYAQNMYAAMCNNRFIRNELWPILKDAYWACSWRASGGIIANMRQSGDYIDWYCSGMGDGLGNGDMTGLKQYVAEGEVTGEIKADLLRLGWVVESWPDE